MSQESHQKEKKTPELSSCKILGAILEVNEEIINKYTRMTMLKALHPWDDIDRLYVTRKEGGRGLASIEDSFDASTQGLMTTVNIAKNKTDYSDQKQHRNQKINRTTITSKQKWKENQLYGYFKWQINEISHEKTWTWLRKWNFRERQNFFRLVAQNNVVRTNYV